MKYDDNIIMFFIVLIALYVSFFNINEYFSFIYFFYHLFDWYIYQKRGKGSQANDFFLKKGVSKVIFYDNS